MVGIAQLVEHRVVVARVAGSSPVTHPIKSAGNSAFFMRKSSMTAGPKFGRTRLTGNPKNLKLAILELGLIM